MAYGYSSFYYTATNAALRATAFIASWLTVQFGLEGVEAWKPGFTIFSAFGETFRFEARRRRPEKNGMIRAEWVLELTSSGAPKCVLGFSTASLLGSSSFSAFYSADLSYPGSAAFLRSYYRFTREFAPGRTMSEDFASPLCDRFESPLLPYESLPLLEARDVLPNIPFLHSLRNDAKRRSLALAMEFLEGVRRVRRQKEDFLDRKAVEALAPASYRRTNEAPLTEEEKIRLLKAETERSLLLALRTDEAFQWRSSGDSAKTAPAPRLNRKMRRALEKKNALSKTGNQPATNEAQNAQSGSASSETVNQGESPAFVPGEKETPEMPDIHAAAESIFRDAKTGARKARLERLSSIPPNEEDAARERARLEERLKASQLREEALQEAREKEDAEFARRLEDISREELERRRIMAAEEEAQRKTEREKASVEAAAEKPADEEKPSGESDARSEATERNRARSEARREEMLARRDEVLRLRSQSTFGDTLEKEERAPLEAPKRDSLHANGHGHPEAGPLSGRLGNLAKTLDLVVAEASAMEAEIALLREQVLREEARTQLWRSAYEEISQSRSAASGEAFRRITANLVTRSNWEPSVEECLQYVEAFRPDRVTVLDSAWESARESSPFLLGRRLLSLLMRLVTDAVDQRAEGGDRRLSSVFSTREYCPRETQETLSARGYAKRRTFRYMGKKLLMEQHLRIGNSRDRGRCLRIYFDFAKTDGRVLIGWCGRHLPCLST